MALFFCAISVFNITYAQTKNGHPVRVVDDADLLSDYEEENLKKQLDSISENLDFDVVVITANTLDGKNIRDYADDYFDYNGYGMGNDRDGVLLAICMDTREWWISTSGLGIDAISNSEIDYIEEQFIEDLSYADYYNGFVKYAELCEQFVQSYYKGDMPKDYSDIIIIFFVSLVFGFIVSLIVVTSMKGQLKTVHYRSGRAYIKPNSMVITRRRDQYLYSNVIRRKIPRQNSGGGYAHHSSSGRSHGGGGGRF